MLYRYAIREQATGKEVDEALFIDVAVKNRDWLTWNATREKTFKEYEIYDRQTGTVLE